MSLKSRMKELKRVKNVQEQNLGDRKDEYVVGIYNGLELAEAIMEGREPNFILCEKEPEEIETKENNGGRTVISGIRKIGG